MTVRAVGEWNCHLEPPIVEPERIVKPRKPYTLDPATLVWDEETNTVLFDEKPGLTWGLVECIKWLSRAENWPRRASSGKPHSGARRAIVLVCRNPQKVLLELHSVFKDNPHWNFNNKHQDTEQIYRDGVIRKPKIKTSKNDHIGYFGFRDGNSRRYFHPISPLDFIDDFNTYYPGVTEIERLLRFAYDVKQFLVENQMRFSITRGGIAGQLLRDSRFYPEARRKVPKQTNEKSRNALPGNYIRWKRNTIPNNIVHHKIIEIDQQNSHHHIAQTISLPNANTLFAHGRFLTESDEPYVRAGHWLFDKLLSEYGLFRLGVLVPKYLNGYLPDWAEPSNTTVRNIYLYSNEIEFAKSLGVDIRYISYCWTSPDTDTGLPKYAEWSQEQIANCDSNRKLWLKPSLVSGYGLLGTRPRHLETGYWKSDSKRAKDEVYWFGPEPITLKQIISHREIQPVFANVVQRGMIEAETRKLSVELARKLEFEFHDVIAIHADALHVRQEYRQLPLLPPPWRVKVEHTHYARIDEVSWKSDQGVCLPGRVNGRTRQTSRA